MTEWTSLWPVTPASHFQQPGSDSEQKTLATSGHTSPDQYELFDLDYASLKMSKATSPSDSERSLESWNKLVTRRRGEYSARVKSGRLTRESGCSFWPTPQTSDQKGAASSDRPAHRKQLRDVKHGLGLPAPANWPTPDASNHRDGEVLRKDNNLEQGGFHGVSLHHAMTKYGQAAPANWSTPNTMDTLPPKSPEGIQRVLTHDGRKNRKSTGNLREDVVQFGLPAPANPSTDGSRQGLWRTPSVAEEKNQNTSTQIYLQNQVGATPKAWATPIMGDSHLASTPKVAQKRIEEGKVTLSRQNPGKLNPRWVETLMGLPVGWVMPSCKSPVTIALTSCDSSATESCQPQPSELFAF